MLFDPLRQSVVAKQGCMDQPRCPRCLFGRCLRGRQHERVAKPVRGSMGKLANQMDVVDARSRSTHQAHVPHMAVAAAISWNAGGRFSLRGRFSHGLDGPWVAI